MTPTPPAPDFAYGPPPADVPRKKSGPLKWILIGCGALAFIGLLSCGGCFLLTYLVISKAIDQAKEQATTWIKSNEKIQEELGEVRSVEFASLKEVKTEKIDGRTRVTFRATVRGDKGTGTVHITITEVDDNRSEVTGVLIKQDGKEIPLGTFKEFRDRSED